MKQRVVLTSELPMIATEILSRDFDVITHSNEGPRAEDDLITILGEADGAITLLTDPVTRRVLESNPNLRIVANCAVGTNNIDLDAARELGIIVTNTPGVLTETTADLTMALILAVTRRIIEGDRFLREGRYHGWHPLLLLGTSLHGKRLGILGLGRIGRAVAERARAFGMEIAFHSRRKTSEIEATSLSLDELLRTSDVLTIHTPLTEETRHIIDTAALAKMKRGSYLINTARGPLVDEAALAAALESGHLAGAGLDVFEREPKVEPRLLSLHQAVLLPHLGSATVETRAAMARIAATEVARVLGGSAARHAVTS